LVDGRKTRRGDPLINGKETSARKKFSPKKTRTRLKGGKKKRGGENTVELRLRLGERQKKNWLRGREHESEFVGEHSNTAGLLSWSGIDHQPKKDLTKGNCQRDLEEKKKVDLETDRQVRHWEKLGAGSQKKFVGIPQRQHVRKRMVVH